MGKISVSIRETPQRSLASSTLEVIGRRWSSVTQEVGT